MAREGLSEEDAFKRLRKASQLSGKPLKVGRSAHRHLDAYCIPWARLPRRDSPRPELRATRWGQTRPGEQQECARV